MVRSVLSDWLVDHATASRRMTDVLIEQPVGLLQGDVRPGREREFGFSALTCSWFA
jgi:hypothetical protein